MTYQYGSFVLSDGVHYTLTRKSYAMTPLKATTFQIGRLYGEKKTGERADASKVDATITVVGSSRADLEAKLDALYAALALRQQHLTLHTLDARYYVADAVAGQAKLTPGQILAVDVPVSFVLLQPFAYAPSASSLTFASLSFAPVRGQTNVYALSGASLPLNIASGGGNFFAHPTIVLTNTATANATTLSAGLAGGSTYTSLSVAALPHAATAGQVFLLQTLSGAFVQRVTLSANASLGATTLSVNSFTAATTFNSGSLCALDIYVQAVTLAQDPDGQVLTVPSASLGATGFGASNTLTITSDPTVSSGQQVIVSSQPTTLLNFSGAFPVVEPVGSTQFFVYVTSLLTPSMSAQVTWTPRWLA